MAGGQGMSVLLSRGVVAWIQLLQNTPKPVSQVSDADRLPAVLPHGVKGEMVRLLATVIMNLKQEEVAYAY
jgi:hypothetical protein